MYFVMFDEKSVAQAPTVEEAEHVAHNLIAQEPPIMITEVWVATEWGTAARDLGLWRGGDRI